jgi:hypothetical protein
MKYLLALCSLLFSVAAYTSFAQAVEVSVGQVRIKLTGPDGFCALDAKHPMDSQVLAAAQQAVQSRNDELAFFVACNRLKDWRAGKTTDLGDTADYQVQKQMKDQTFAAKEILPATCTVLRQQGATIIKNAEGEINKNFKSIESLAGALQLNSQQMYGVLHEDKTGCYGGIIQKLQLDNKEHTLFIVMAITVVKGRVIYFYHASPLKGPATITRLLKTTRKTVAATLAQN